MKTREEPLLAIILKAFAILSAIGGGALLAMSMTADPAGGTMAAMKATAQASAGGQMLAGGIALWWMGFMVAVLERIAVATEVSKVAAAVRPVEAKPAVKASKLRGGVDDEAGTWKIG
jgi:hypothetical protein